MIDLNRCNEWQHRDADGMILPWYTKSFLDELVTWDLKDLAVLEIGMGASTLWWNKKCKYLSGCENNFEFFGAVWLHLWYPKNTWLHHFTELQHFTQFIDDNKLADIIVIDCDPVEWRDACIQTAAKVLTPGGRLIIDNWDQPSVWVPSDETRKLLVDWPVKIYSQEGHADWKTAVFTKP